MSSNVSFHIDRMADARWVKAQLYGIWMSAWLQKEEGDGFWVQFDPEGPFRFVSQIRDF